MFITKDYSCNILFGRAFQGVRLLLETTNVVLDKYPNFTLYRERNTINSNNTQR